MKTSVIQMHIAFGSIADNRIHARELIEEAAETRPDVIVLPELFTTGFYPRPIADYADAGGKETRAFLSELAQKHRVNIVGGSVATKIGARIFNTCYVIGREGETLGIYHKAHLFSPGGEDLDFAAGNTVVHFQIDTIPCALAICYDLRFPEFIRRLALEGAAVVFLPAAWPSARLLHWETLLRARAIENQIYIVAANGVSAPTDDNPLAGHSAIIGPWGDLLAGAEGEETILHAKPRLLLEKQIRASMDVLADRRPALYRVRK